MRRPSDRSLLLSAYLSRRASRGLSPRGCTSKAARRTWRYGSRATCRLFLSALVRGGAAATSSGGGGSSSMSRSRSHGGDYKRNDKDVTTTVNRLAGSDGAATRESLFMHRCAFLGRLQIVGAGSRQQSSLYTTPRCVHHTAPPRNHLLHYCCTPRDVS